MRAGLMAGLAAFVFVAIVTQINVVPVRAQDATETADATAQSSAEATADAPTPNVTPGIASAQIRTLTQSDLSILTGNVQRPNGIVWHDGKLYTACTGDWTLYQLDSSTGETITYIYGVRNAHTLYAENDENGELVLWVPDFQSNSLARVTRNGVRPVAQNLKGPWGIAPLDEDNFLVSNLLGNTLDKIDRTGKSETLVSDLQSPTGVITDGKMIYVANNGSTRRSVEWYTTDTLKDGKATDTLNHVLVTGLQNVTDIVMGPDSYVYMAYSLGTRGIVGRVDPVVCRAKGCTREDVQVVVQTDLAAPLAGLAVSPDMRVFVHTMFSPDIYWAQLDKPADGADD
jgi:hypothetical protein